MASSGVRATYDAYVVQGAQTATSLTNKNFAKVGRNQVGIFSIRFTLTQGSATSKTQMFSYENVSLLTDIDRERLIVD